MGHGMEPLQSNFFFSIPYLVSSSLILEASLTAVGEPMVLVVALLMEAFPAVFTDKRSVPLMDPHVGVECRTPVEGLATGATLVRFLRGVDDLVPAQGRGLAESFSADLAYKWPGSWNNHMVRNHALNEMNQTNNLI